MTEQFILEKADFGVSTLIVQEAMDDDSDAVDMCIVDFNFDSDDLACSSFVRLFSNSCFCSLYTRILVSLRIW